MVWFWSHFPVELGGGGFVDTWGKVFSSLKTNVCSGPSESPHQFTKKEKLEAFRASAVECIRHFQDSMVRPSGLVAGCRNLHFTLKVDWRVDFGNPCCHLSRPLTSRRLFTRQRATLSKVNLPSRVNFPFQKSTGLAHQKSTCLA